ncbi:hypothetical protein JG688_00018484 [Phytophthora aleatoria]|uniref:Uncharacterized protein n=1 Tax=Phytophthora aleatoria TaxID=2496075 RepID=A0A8J5M0L3_9STRA|nr:hypothetical protein JG688_00018484 [Phytophthora aleatoria]
MNALAKACNHTMAVDSHTNTKASSMSSEREGFAECIILNTTVDPFANAKAVPNIARVRGLCKRHDVEHNGEPPDGYKCQHEGCANVAIVRGL